MDRINHQTWGTTETALAGTFGLAVVCFAFLYVFLIFGLHNEIVAVNRQRSLIHALGWVAMVLYVGLLYFDLMENADIVWPSLGVLRPVLCIVFGAFYFFTTTHPLFRWVSLLLSAFSVICNTLASAELFIVITCRSNSTCTNRGMFSVLMLELQWVRSLADIFIGTMLFMFIVAMFVSMGWCFSRYPPRLFDSSVPLSYVPESSGGNPQLLIGFSETMQQGWSAFDRNQDMQSGIGLAASGEVRDDDAATYISGVGSKKVKRPTSRGQSELPPPSAGLRARQSSRRPQ